jgi:hypothetical protein
MISASTRRFRYLSITPKFYGAAFRADNDTDVLECPSFHMQTLNPV